LGGAVPPFFFEKRDFDIILLSASLRSLPIRYHRAAVLLYTLRRALIGAHWVVL